MTPSDPVMRPITGREELGLFCELHYVLNDEVADDLGAGRRRPEWMWVALDDERVVARVAWWGAVDSTPEILDIVDIDDHATAPERLHIGVRLLQTALGAVVGNATSVPDYSRLVPPDWRQDDASRRIVEDRITMLEQVGARLFVERLRLEWRVGSPIPAPSTRLRFRPLRDTDELLAVMTAALDGTLDAHGRDDLSRMPADEAAKEHFDDELARLSSPRSWWRIATLADGEPVGFVIPARNAYGPIIAYIAVLPKHRGKGYIDDILGEGTRLLAAQGVRRIRASTDLGNVPMAAAFHRAGYVNFEREIRMRWSRTP